MTIIKLHVILGQPPSDVTYALANSRSSQGTRVLRFGGLTKEVGGGKRGEHGVLKLDERVRQLCDLDRTTRRVRTPLLLLHWTQC
jgi:hypothetical protein